MKLSKLIEYLSAIKTHDGDIEVTFFNSVDNINIGVGELTKKLKVCQEDKHLFIGVSDEYLDEIASKTFSIGSFVQECHSAEAGSHIYHELKAAFERANDFKISFKGISSITTSFINCAFIPFLDDFGIEWCKANLNFVDSNRLMNEMIKKRFNFYFGGVTIF